MNSLHLFIGLAALLIEAKCYVLLQVRKSDNQSNVDALIHKVVPSDKFDKIANTARKQFNYKRYEVKSNPNDNELESIVFAIKTDEDSKGDRRNYRREEKSDVFDKIQRKVLEFFKTPDARDLPSFRAKMKKYNIKPEVVSFKNSNGKPSMMFELETQSVLQALKNMLTSKKFQKFTDSMVNKAAIFFRTFKEELEKTKE